MLCFHCDTLLAFLPPVFLPCTHILKKNRKSGELGIWLVCLVLYIGGGDLNSESYTYTVAAQLSNLRDPLKDFPVSYFELHFSNKGIFILKKHLAFPVLKTVSFVEGEFGDAWPWFSISLPT